MPLVKFVTVLYFDNGTVSKNPLLQEESRKKVLTLTDFIIPGHGDIFIAAVKLLNPNLKFHFSSLLWHNCWNLNYN